MVYDYIRKTADDKDYFILIKKKILKTEDEDARYVWEYIKIATFHAVYHTDPHSCVFDSYVKNNTYSTDIRQEDYYLIFSNIFNHLRFR